VRRATIRHRRNDTSGRDRAAIQKKRTGRISESVILALAWEAAADYVSFVLRATVNKSASSHRSAMVAVQHRSIAAMRFNIRVEERLFDIA